MEIPHETEDYIRESIDHAVGLPVSTDTLLNKLRAVEASHDVLRNQYLCLQSKLKEKDDIIDRSRAEASMNAVALKKFVEENQKLAVECSNLLESCKKWEKECLLYDHDREALMDFANEADERAKMAEARHLDLQEENAKLMEEIKLYKLQSENLLVDGNTSDQEVQLLLDSLLTTLFGKDEIATSTVCKFLELQSGVEVCEEILKKWPSLNPLTQKIIAVIADVKNLKKEKEHLTMNLRKAEEEVNVLFVDNNVLNEENKRLIRQCYKDKQIGGGNSSGKGKRKSSNTTSICSPMEKKIDVSDSDSQRQPLSPLQCNSPESRMRKK